MSPRRGAALAAALAAATVTCAGQEPPPRVTASPVTFGPRLLDYHMECVDPRGCRIECFQQGTSVAQRGKIGVQDEMRLVIAASAADDIAQRWIEIRPFSGSDVETLLLTPETFCTLTAIVVAPKRRP